MIVLIDNYDSFTFNLFHYLGSLGAEVVVHRNDKIAADAVVAAEPEAIVLSPGPCTPKEAGICIDLIRKAAPTIPIMGVCLGHQAIGEAFGGHVVRAPVLVHGKLSEVKHQGKTLFRGINGPFRATRYHSLVVDRGSLPPELPDHGGDRRPADHGSVAREAAGAWRAVPSREHRLRARAPDPAEFPRPRRGVERRDRPRAAPRARPRARGAAMDDLKPLIAKAATGARARARGGRAGVRPHDVGRGHALADGRPADGAAGARRDRRGDHRRGADHARQDAARSRRRAGAVDVVGTGGDASGSLQHLDLRGLHRGRRRRSGRQARQSRAVLAVGRGRRAGGARREDRSRARSTSAAASAKPASASCSRRRIIRR